jgi:hypothetical protein
MNDFAPQHSRIFKEVGLVFLCPSIMFVDKPALQMILVASPSKPFEYTLKMAPRRPTIIAEYEPEINAVYEAVKETTQAASVLPEVWTPENTLGFVQSVVQNVLKEEVADDSDIFQHGCDRCASNQPSTSLHGLVLSCRLQSAGYMDQKFYFAWFANDDRD